MESPSSSLLHGSPLSLFEFVDLVSVTLDTPVLPSDAPELASTSKGTMRRALRKLKSRASAVVLRGPFATTPAIAATPRSKSPAEYRIPELRLSVNNSLADGFMPYLPLVAQYERGYSSSIGTPSASSCSSASTSSTDSDYPRTPPSTIFDRRWSAPSSPKSENPTFERQPGPVPTSLPFPQLAASTPDVEVCHTTTTSMPQVRIRRHASSAPRRPHTAAVRTTSMSARAARGQPTNPNLPRRDDSPDWSALLAAFPPPPTYMPPVPTEVRSRASSLQLAASTRTRHRRDFTLDLDLDLDFLLDVDLDLGESDECV
ncbi:hypothetical protein FB45DRAFT_939536 [Roridomyces roridus]|uniref:Uncharacterized protein n=1 Tax=Roridomyces roridus TaxID=1738132 RepID=A0AAD7FAR4_9AGAR|nr:hypothetical protein FB45DRAFT_939536 [Roridomyces roridus]